MTAKIEIVKYFFWWMLLIGFLAWCGKASAQVLPEYSAFPKKSIGLQLGTQGIGLQGTETFLGAFNARIGFNTVPGISIQYNGREAMLNRTSVYGIVDWQPFYGQSNWFARKWYISSGISYYFENTLYRQGTNTVPNYYIYMSKLRPYIGTGLGNLQLSNSIGIRTDFGFFIPTSAPTSTYDDKGSKVSSGLRGLLPGMNTAVTFYIKF